MDITIKVYKVNSLTDIKEETKIVNEVNYLRVNAKLELDYENIVNLIKHMKESGIITNIFYPQNKKLQKEIDNLVKIKRDIKNSIRKIKEVF